MQHHNGLSDHPMQPHGPTPQQNRQLMELLVAAELQQYSHCLSSQLNVNTVRQLKAVPDEDFVAVIGMSKPEVRRLRKFIKKMAGQSGTLEKIKNILTKSTHETSELCCLPVTDRSPTSFLIDQSDITISRELGRGTFGSVHGGTWITTSGSKLPIAARKCALVTSPKERDHFFSSAQSLHLLKHPNLVRLIGVSMTTTHFLMVMEQAPSGQSLKSWLQNQSQQQQQQQQLSLSVLLGQLVEFVRQVCAAMTHLESSKFVHGDVSSRNVLVFSENLVKVCDHGLRASLDREDAVLRSLVERNSEKLAWLAPECIEKPAFSTFTISSDVWSYGVTMWEIFSLGASPSWGASGSTELLSLLKSGKALDRPRLCPNDLHSVMLDCWKFNPQERPAFQQMGTRLIKTNLVRLQAEVDSTKTGQDKESQLQLSAGDVVTVLDSSCSDSPVVGWWNGLNETTNRIGFFNPVDMKLFLSGDGAKQSVAKQLVGSSGALRKGKSGHQKPRLTAGMISLPLNDLRHTSHVGRDGETFSCEMIPISRMNTPSVTERADEMTRSTSSAISSTISVSPTSETETRTKKRAPPIRPSQKPPLLVGSERMLNGTPRDSPPVSAPVVERGSTSMRELTSKLSVGSNLSGDILTRVKYSPSSLSMVSADLSHVTSLMSSDTLTDVSSLPGDIGSLSKSDYEDYDCMDGEHDETFDVTTTDVDDDRSHLHDTTIVSHWDESCNGDCDDYQDDDSPRTIEEPHTPKILDTSSSLFDEVMFALGGGGGGGQQPSKPMQNGHHPKTPKKATFDVYDSEDTDSDLSKKSSFQTKKPIIREDFKSFHARSQQPERTSAVEEHAGSNLMVVPKNAEESRNQNGRRNLSNVESINTCSTISLMSSCSDLKSSDSSLSSDATALAHSSHRDISRTSVLSKISNVLNRNRNKDGQRRFSQASTVSQLSVAMSNASIPPSELDLYGAKLSSSSFSGFDGKKQKVIPVDSLPLQQDKYPSFLPSKQRSLKNSKAKDKLRRSSLILATVFQPKRDEKSRRPAALPMSNFNTNELFFNKLREQELEMSARAELDLRKLREEEGEAESEDSGVALQSLNQSREVVPPCPIESDHKDFGSSPTDSPRQETKKDLCYEADNSLFVKEDHEEEVSDLSDILLRLNMIRNQGPLNSYKCGTQNGNSPRDLTSIAENIQQSYKPPKKLDNSDNIGPQKGSNAFQLKLVNQDIAKHELLINNNKHDLHMDFQLPAKIGECRESHYTVKRDPFLPNGNKLTLARSCSSGSDSPEVVDV